MEYCFSRQPFSPDGNMVAVQMQFTNNATSEAKNLHMEDVKLQSGMRVKEFPEIGEFEEELQRCSCFTMRRMSGGMSHMQMMSCLKSVLLWIVRNTDIYHLSCAHVSANGV